MQINDQPDRQGFNVFLTDSLHGTKALGSYLQDAFLAALPASLLLIRRFKRQTNIPQISGNQDGARLVA